MNFRPTIIKFLLAITIGVISALYFLENCIYCRTNYLHYELIVGFIPSFLWVYGLISLLQRYEEKSKLWHYLVAIPSVIIFPLLIGLILQVLFKLL